MREVVYDIDLDLQEYDIKACMQNDDINLIVNIFKKEKPYDLTGAKATLNWSKPDGTPLKENMNIDKNMISVTLNKDYTDIRGKARLDIEITKEGTISTFPLVLVIVEKVFQSNKVNNKIVELLDIIKMDEYVDEFLDGIKKKQAELSSQIDDIVSNVTNGNESATNSEIVVARAGLASLGTRLDKIENAERLNKNTIDLFHLNNSIKDIFNTRVTLDIFKTEKGFLRSDGVMLKNETSTYAMIYYDVSELEYVTIEGCALEGTSVYGLLNSNEEIYKYKPFEVMEVLEKTIDVRLAKYIVVNSQNNITLTVSKYESIKEIKTGLNNKLDTLTNSIAEELENVKIKTKDITEMIEAEKIEKGFLNVNGTINKNDVSTYSLNYYNVENINGLILKGTILKSTAYGFADSNENVLGYVSAIENTEINEVLNIPKGAKYLLVTTQAISGFTLEAYKNISVSESVNNLKTEIGKIKSKIKSNYWEGKTIWICGTSVPAGDGNKNTYPYMLGQILGCKVINEAVGGSSICCKEKTSSNWHNMPNSFSTAYRCFSNTLEEQEWVIEQMAEGGVYEGNGMDADYIRSLSYEKKLMPYLNGTYQCPDLFIIEHGPNDLRTTESFDESAPYDLCSYYGAMNYIIKTIYEYQPQARVMVMGHYENQSPKRIIKAGEDDYGARTIAARGIVPGKQQKVAEMWNIPIFKAWEYMGWSQMRIKTKGKWVSGYWQENYYNSPVEMTMLAYNLPDQTHPHSDKSGKANLKIAESLAEFLESNIR